MRLTDLLKKAIPESTVPASDVEIAGVTDRSSEVGPGFLFVAIPGVAVDGHSFISDAVAHGAVAIVGSRPAPPEAGDRPYLQVENPRRALARLLHAFHGFPMQDMLVVGITGTNGKSTTAYLVESILAAAGRKPGLIGTIEYRFGAGRDMAAQTTPHPAILMRYLDEMRGAGVDSLVMEVSSHALVQDRVEGIPFRVAALTNLTHEHLDFHKTREAYIEAKWKFFADFLPRCPEGIAVFNLDDPVGAGFNQRFRGDAVTYGANSNAEVRGSNIRSSTDGTQLTVETPSGSREVHSALCGEYNAWNILAAAASGLAADLPLDAVVEGIEALSGVPGRFERVEVDAPFEVYVDFAHTPDALERVLHSARRIAGDRRLICLFGAGGDRDPSKREPMGAAVARYADRAIIAKDNSRFEDPKRIAEMLARGLESVRDRDCQYEIILDRREAICAALNAAGEGDVVFLAGKGHELYENEQGELRPWDDRQVVRELLAERKNER